MVKRLRNKFVIVTTSLMVIVLGGFLLINTLYNNYWNGIEIVDMLEWIADSGVFYLPQSDINEQMIEELSEDEQPIVGIMLDKDFRVVEKYTLGKEDGFSVSTEILSKMCDKHDETNKIGRYYYSYSEIDEDHILLVVMDTWDNEKSLQKIMGYIALALLGIILLVIITLFLSRFVTGPAEESLMREKRFISDASHELKTPIGAISINAQAIKMSEGDNLYINNIITESDRMNRLIEKLLTLSKLDEEPQLVFERINLSEICEEMALTYESLVFEKKIEFEYVIKDSIWMKGDRDEIRQLIAILLDNAIKNTPEYGTITMTVGEKNNKKTIKISNTGKGICEADIDHVFERFYTSDHAREKNSFGLGLAIAKAIVEGHKGTIKVDSVIDEKTSFEVMF